MRVACRRLEIRRRDEWRVQRKGKVRVITDRVFVSFANPAAAPVNGLVEQTVIAEKERDGANLERDCNVYLHTNGLPGRRDHLLPPPCDLNVVIPVSDRRRERGPSLRQMQISPFFLLLNIRSKLV